MKKIEIGSEVTVVIRGEYPEAVQGRVIAIGPEHVTIRGEYGLRRILTMPIDEIYPDLLPGWELLSQIEHADKIINLIDRQKFTGSVTVNNDVSLSGRLQHIINLTNELKGLVRERLELRMLSDIQSVAAKCIEMIAADRKDARIAELERGLADFRGAVEEYFATRRMDLFKAFEESNKVLSPKAATLLKRS